jgi:hypothetical protein
LQNGQVPKTAPLLVAKECLDSGTKNALRKLPTKIYTSHEVIQIVLIHSFKEMNIKKNIAHLHVIENVSISLNLITRTLFFHTTNTAMLLQNFSQYRDKIKKKQNGFFKERQKEVFVQRCFPLLRLCSPDGR